MRLGGPIFATVEGPEAWAAAVRAEGYRAAYCPLPPTADLATCQAYAAAAADADVVVAEVGAWSNPISPDGAIRAAALEQCKAGLALADRVGALCCVNIAGGRGAVWDGPHPDNVSEDTFALIVDTVREIIDAVQPQRADYTLETMPWVPPHSVDSYERLVQAIDRPRFGVHFDPVNLVNSPDRYFANGALVRDFVNRLGPYIRSCHAKDIVLRNNLTVHLDECLPGTGGLDYAALLSSLARLHADLPVMLEHLATPDDYRQAATHVRGVAATLGLNLEGA